MIDWILIPALCTKSFITAEKGRHKINDIVKFVKCAKYIHVLMCLTLFDNFLVHNCSHCSQTRTMVSNHVPVVSAHLTDIPVLFEQNFFRDPLLKLGVTPVNKRLLKYPKREAEYHLIFNMFYGLYRALEEDLKNVLNDNSVFKCPGINDLLPNETAIQEKRNLCYSLTLFAVCV